MKYIDIAEAQVTLEDLVDKAAAGEAMVITKNGVAIARLIAFRSPRIGMLEGQFEFDDKASAEMDKEIEALFTESDRLPKN